ncbi:MAG: hypothetical protein EKK42_00770 [Pseudonocardiaceae bacterium]|nr:MAG: hypothetical protein EKK42_00770 [Pseudonocardiaceae bacterium]
MDDDLLADSELDIPVQRDADAQPDYVSVGALMRREGRAPHSFDRPLKPRASRLERGADDPVEERASGRRRMTAAAAAMLTIGGVLGAAVFTDAASNSSAAQDQLDGSFPGRGGAGDGSGAALPSPGNALAAGTAAPTSWMNVAFPSALPQAASAGRGGAGGAGGVFSGSGGSGGAGGVGGVGGSGSGGNGGVVTDPGGGTAGNSGGGPSDEGPVAGTIPTIAGPAAGGVRELGKTKPFQGTVVETVTDTLATTVENAGENGADVVQNVQKTAGNLLRPATGPVRSIAPALAPVLDAVAPSDAVPAGAQPESVVETVGTGVENVAGSATKTVVGAAGDLLGGLTGGR